MGEMEIPDELIDQLLGEYRGPEQLTGPDGLINQLRKRLIERAAGAAGERTWDRLGAVRLQQRNLGLGAIRLSQAPAHHQKDPNAKRKNGYFPRRSGYELPTTFIRGK